MKKDLLELGISFEETTSSQITKVNIKALARTAAFKDLWQRKDNQKKLKHYQSYKWEIQPYLKSEIKKKNKEEKKEAHSLTSVKNYLINVIQETY